MYCKIVNRKGCVIFNLISINKSLEAKIKNNLNFLTHP